MSATSALMICLCGCVCYGIATDTTPYVSKGEQRAVDVAYKRAAMEKWDREMRYASSE